MTLTIDNNESDTTFEDIIWVILSQDNVMLSVKSTGAMCEVNTEMNLPLRVSDQYAIIGDETRPWHIHIHSRNQGS
jgi:hypothetical protein